MLGCVFLDLLEVELAPDWTRNWVSNGFGASACATGLEHALGEICWAGADRETVSFTLLALPERETGFAIEGAEVLDFDEVQTLERHAAQDLDDVLV